MGLGEKRKEVDCHIFPRLSSSYRHNVYYLDGDYLICPFQEERRMALDPQGLAFFLVDSICRHCLVAAATY